MGANDNPGDIGVCSFTHIVLVGGAASPPVNLFCTSEGLSPKLLLVGDVVN